MDKIKFVIADKALKYIESLNNDVQGKIFSSVDFIVNNGFVLSSKKKLTKKVSKNLFEIRIKSSEGIERLFYFKQIKSQYVIINGFTKKSNKIPLKELKHAEKLRHDYLNKGING